MPKSKKQTKASPHVQWLGVSNELRQETAILDLCISRNGRFAATVDDQHVIRVFDLAAGTCRGSVKIPAKSLKQFEQVSGVSVADDGAHVLAAIDTGFVSGDLTAVKQTLFGYTGSAQMLADGRGYVQLQGTLRYVDGSGSDVKVTHGAFSGAALDVAADGRVACALWNGDEERGLLRVLSPTRKELASIETGECTYNAKVGFVDEDNVVCVTQKDRVLWWNLTSGQLRAQTLPFEHPQRLLAPLRALVVARGARHDVVHLETGAILATGTAKMWAVSADGRTLISAEGGTIARHDPATFAPRDAAPLLRTPVRGVAFDPAGAKFWSIDDEHVHCWDVRDATLAPTTINAPDDDKLTRRGSGARIAIAYATGAADPMASLARWRAVSDDGMVVVTVDDDGFRATDATGAVKRTWPRTPQVGVSALSPNGSRFIWSDREGLLHVVNTATGTRIAQLPAPKGRVVFSMALSRDAKRVATCTDSSTIHVLDVDTGEIVHELKVKRRTADPVAFSSDGRWIAASDQVVTIIWDAHSGAKHVALDVGAHALAFSPDAKRLALGGVGVVGVITIEQ